MFNSIKDKIYLIVIGILILFVLFQRSCGSNTITIPGKTQTIIETKVDTQYVKVTKTIPKYIPRIIERVKTEYIPTDIDTAEILKDYYSTNIYKDSIKIDSLGHVVVTDSINQNKIKNRKVDLNYQAPIITKETTITKIIPDKTKVYLGVSAIGNRNNPLSYVGPELMLKTKNDKVYAAGAGYSPLNGVNVKVGILWKIKIK